MVKVPPGVVVLRLVALMMVQVHFGISVADDSGCKDGIGIPLCWSG